MRDEENKHGNNMRNRQIGTNYKQSGIDNQVEK